MKILFLHGWKSVVGGVKPTYLESHGHEVRNPALGDDDFDQSVQIADAHVESFRPAVILGSSRGGAVAMNLADQTIPRVLLCPAWKRWGSASVIQFPVTILHSRFDDVIPFCDSQQLLLDSDIDVQQLIEIGNDHRLADPAPLEAMLGACQRMTSIE